MCRTCHFKQFFNFQIVLSWVHSPMMVSALNLPNLMAGVIFHCRTIASTMEIINLESPLWSIIQKCENYLTSSKAQVCSIPLWNLMQVNNLFYSSNIWETNSMLLAGKLPYLLILHQLFNSMWVVPNTFNTRIKNSGNSSFLYVIFHSHRDQLCCC